MAAKSEDSGRIEKLQDPNEYKQRQRIKNVLEARERVLERRGEALDAYYQGYLDEQGRNTILREAVERFIFEVEEQLTGHEDAEYYWKEKYLGQLKVEETGETYNFKGLRSITESPNPITFTVYTESESVGAGETPDPYQIEYQIPENVLMKAWRSVNEFLAKIGFDVDLKQQEVEAVGKYSDILEGDIDE